MDVVWATLLAFAYFLRRRYPRGSLVIFLAVLSHWLLDFVSHRPDLPIAPHMHTYVGLGLWNSIPATLLVEGSFWCLAVILYVRGTRSKSLRAAFYFWIGIILLTFVWFGNIAGPLPRNPRAAPFASLTLFLLTVAWAYWIDRARVPGPTRASIKK